jgi:hypothetical protein
MFNGNTGVHAPSAKPNREVPIPHYMNLENGKLNEADEMLATLVDITLTTE